MSDTLNRVDAVALVLADFFHGSTDVTNGGVLAAARLAVDAADAAVDYEAGEDAIPKWLSEWLAEAEPNLALDAMTRLIVDAALGRQSNE